MRKLQGEEKDHKTLVLFKKLRSHTNEEQVMQIFSHVLLQLVICCCRNSDLTSAVAVNAYVKSWIKRRNEREALTGHHYILLLVFLKIGYFKKASEMFQKCVSEIKPVLESIKLPQTTGLELIFKAKFHLRKNTSISCTGNFNNLKHHFHFSKELFLYN